MSDDEENVFLLGGLKGTIRQQEAEIERLRAIITAKLHRRKCHDCGQLEWTSKDMGKVHTCDECYRKFLERVKEVKE